MKDIQTLAFDHINLINKLLSGDKVLVTDDGLLDISDNDFFENYNPEETVIPVRVIKKDTIEFNGQQLPF